MPRQPAPDSTLEELADELEDARVLESLELGGEDERAWLDFELASLAENRIGDATDPRSLDMATRGRWVDRATTEPLFLPSRRDLERCFWLLEAGERIGTIALASSLLGSDLLRISSLYVLPERRGRGIARGALGHVVQGLSRYDLGLRLSTSWTWQRAVRLYMKMGMWVLMWKRDLEFRWSAMEPAPRIEIGDTHAKLSVELDGAEVVLCTAERDGDSLSLSERLKIDDRRVSALAWDAMSTLSLGLALSGWPLVRSREQWDRCYGADAGPPESLAYRIMIWEAWDQKHGYQVDAPRIANLAYPSWDELEAHWKRQAEELQKKSFRPP